MLNLDLDLILAGSLYMALYMALHHQPSQSSVLNLDLDLYLAGSLYMALYMALHHQPTQSSVFNLDLARPLYTSSYSAHVDDPAHVIIVIYTALTHTARNIYHTQPPYRT